MILYKYGIFDFLKNNFISNNEHITAQTAVKYIKAMVLQRIVQADSKLALVNNYEQTPLKHFLDLDNNKLDLQSLYRSLEILEDNFSFVEKYLYQLAVKQFNQNEKELYYDITSSYFEGNKCIIAEFGYSRDKRKDKEQIIIGLVTTASGFPIKCNIYPGNRPDKTTVIEVVEQLKKEYPIDEIVFVGDRGMLTANNIKAIEKLKQKYVMAIPRAWSKKYLKNIEIKANKMDKINDELYAKFIPSPDKNQRFLLCLNVNKKADDNLYRQGCIDKIKKSLNKLIKSIGQNKHIKTKDDAMKKAGAIMKMNNTGKYFSIQTIDSDINSLGFTITYQLKKEKLESDKKLDGTFLIQTNETSYTKNKLLDVYKNLSKVENAFKVIKNDLDIRPMFHRKENRIKGHVYVCVISYFLIMAIDYISQKNNLNKSARNILQVLDAIKLIDINLPDGAKKYSLKHF